MQCIIKGEAYNFIDNVMEEEITRKSYFQLAKEIYKLKYEKWYQSGYMDNRYKPYILMYEDTAVSSVAVCLLIFIEIYQRRYNINNDRNNDQLHRE